MLTTTTPHAPSAAARGKRRRSPITFGRRALLSLIVFFKRFVLPLLIPRLIGRRVPAIAVSPRHGDVPVTLHVGRRLGVGMKGAAYRIERIDGHPSEKSRMLPLVLKVPHALRLFGAFRRRFERILADELQSYRALVDALPHIERDALFPPDAAFARGSFPVAPILAAGRSRFGLGLVKTELVGDDVRSMAARIGRAIGPRPMRADDLPPPLRASVRDWFHLSNAATRHVRVRDAATGDERSLRSLDINPDNLVWVDDPAQLALFRLSRPSLVAVELGEPHLITYCLPELAEGRALARNIPSESDYLDLWIAYLERAR